MKRDSYKAIAEGTGQEEACMLDAVRKIFVEAMEISFPKRDREMAVGEANKLWNKQYEERAKIRLGLKG